MNSDYLDLASLDALMQTGRLGKAAGWANEVWDTIDSTNTRALELAKAGAAEGVIIAARQQTAGRGRLGRVWVSPPDSGLYISFLLRPKLPIAQVPIMSLIAGTAVAKAIEHVCGVRVGLKWVNDITYGGKKIGGVLAEMTSARASGTDAATGAAVSAATNNSARTDSSAALVIGIGINLRMDRASMPAELQQTAEAVENISSAPVNANQLAATLALELEIGYELLLQGERTQVLTRWKEYSITLGKRVQAISGDKTIEGTAIDLANDGALVLRLDDGKDMLLLAGEVSIRNVDGSYA